VTVPENDPATETPVRGEDASIRLLLVRRAFSAVLLCIVVAVAWTELEHLDWARLHRDVQSLPLATLILLIAAGALAVFAMSAYDALLAHWQGIRLPARELLRLSWVANSFNNFVGFSGLAGSGIRYLLLSRAEVPTRQAIGFSGTVLTSIPVGLAVLAWSALTFGQTHLHALGNMRWPAILALTAFALYLPVYWWLSGSPQWSQRWGLELAALTRRQRVTLIAVSVCDWMLAASLAWACLRVAGAVPNWPEFMLAFTAAAALGIFSLLPGGFGVFDTVLFYALSAIGLPANSLLTGILLFRLVYYLLPWLVGIYLGAELLVIDDQSFIARVSARWRRSGLWGFIRLPLNLTATLGVRLLAWLILLSGIVLLVSAAYPALKDRLAILDRLLPLGAVESSHLLSVIIGVMLVGAARGIHARVRGAYRLAMVLLTSGALFSLLKGIDYEEALFLTMVAALLRMRRRDFYRAGFPLLSARTLVWTGWLFLAILGFMLLGSVIYGGIDLTRVLDFAFHLDQSRFIRALFGAWLASLLVLGWTLFLVPRPPLSLPDRDALAAARAFLRQHGGNDLAHLALLGDKYLRYSSDNRAMIQFGRIGNRLVALGDPNGDEAAIAAAIGEFRTFADLYDLDPVFYEISERHLGHYHELGFSLFKLGETARVSTAEFTLQGKRNESLRHSAKHAIKAGAAVEILEGPIDEPTWAILADISTRWLREKRVAEKGFSLGRFSRPYLEQAPIAVVRIGERIVAFASLVPQYGKRRALSIDLMRYVSEAPAGTMDLLFTELIAYARDHGFVDFDLGMAPLSGVGASRFAKPQERLAQITYRYGDRFYNYKGVRAFKEKYHPRWESRYLAYPAGVPVARLLADTAALVAGGYRRILFREIRS